MLGRRSAFNLIAAAVAAVANSVPFGKLAAADTPSTPRHPDYVWDSDNWETTYPYQDIDCSLAERLEPGDLMQVGRAVRIPDIWIVRDHDDELHECETFEQAKSISDAARAHAAARDTLS